MKTASAITAQIPVPRSSGFHHVLREMRATNYRGLQPLFFKDLPYIKQRSIRTELKRQKPKFCFDRSAVWNTKDLINYKTSVQGLMFWERFEMDYPIIIF